ncbi:MAG: protein-L-isoaspartate(D-aspartate) O-methyltransferase [Sedimentisphaerales bacterium]|nr:protein-L-isoaspartate(D-aspartate) O-methyltransferase [Sedimentisphaerales bacterium]
MSRLSGNRRSGSRGVRAMAFVFATALLAGCDRTGTEMVPPDNSDSPPAARPSATGTEPNDTSWFRPRSDERARERAAMVDQIQQVYGLESPTVLKAMRNVPRHWFILPSNQSRAYQDQPLLIGYGQTISQPFIVAYMTDVLKLEPDDKVLEIGTGSGYQAAVLYEFTPHVYTIEIVEPLARRAKQIFHQYGYNRIDARTGDGYKGLPDIAPFDAIIVTCAPDHIPRPLLDQLVVGGRMIIPVGDQWGLQELILVSKQADGSITRESKMPVRFVPLTRE